MSHLVSVIVPCYNQAYYLPEALESVLKQTFEHWECIIVNDGSLDNTEEVAFEWTKKDKRFKYLKKDNAGLSSARNYGIKNSIGEYILPLDADDKIADTYLEEAIKIFMSNPKVKLVYAKARFFDLKDEEWKLEQYSKSALLLYNMIYCSAFFRKADYDKTKGYNSNMIFGWEDWDFWLTILNDGDEVYKIPKILFYYRIKETSMIKNIDQTKMQYLYRQLYINHSDLYNELFPDPITLYNDFENLRARLNNIENSKYYKFGRFIKKVLNKIGF